MPDETALRDRVALLTGPGGALGRRLIAVGARIVFTYSAHGAEAERLVGDARAAGLDAVALSGDLADPAVPVRPAEQTTAALGPVDVLVANAGHADRRPYTELDTTAWDRMTAVGLCAPFLLAQAVLRHGYLTNQVIGLDGGLHPR